MGVNSNITNSISMVVEQKEMLDMALRICKGYLSGAWKRVTAQDICVKRMSGGLTNMLYHVTLLSPPAAPPSRDGNTRGVEAAYGKTRSSAEPREVLLRIYGQTHGERALESIITDSVIFTLLSERKLGPTLHGVFPGGRIEEYIPARSLTVPELVDPRISAKIAEKMADIHLMQIPVVKEPCWLWDTIQRWLTTLYLKRSTALAPNTSSEGGTLMEEFNKRQKSLVKKIMSHDLNKEADWLKKHLVKINSPVVFCHNDLQEGNILYRESQNNNNNNINKINNNNIDLVVIDFEYCSYNYRAFDIANHFVETMYDYSSKHFPHYTVRRDCAMSQTMRRQFIQTYLSRMSEETTAVDTVLEEVRHFTMASHFFWALWSFVHDENSEIPFGYWDYGLERLGCYYRLKDELCPETTESNGVKRKATTRMDI